MGKFILKVFSHPPSGLTVLMRTQRYKGKLGQLTLKASGYSRGSLILETGPLWPEQVKSTGNTCSNLVPLLKAAVTILERNCDILATTPNNLESYLNEQTATLGSVLLTV